MKRTMSWVFALVFSVIMMLWTLPSQAMATEVQQPTKAEVATMQLAQVQQPSKEEVRLAQGLYADNLPEAAAEEAIATTGLYVDNLPEAAAEEGGVMPTAAGNVVFACVNANGTLSSSQRLGAISSTKIGTGVYDVRFNRNVRNCAYLATIGLCGFTGTTFPQEKSRRLVVLMPPLVYMFARQTRQVLLKISRFIWKLNVRRMVCL